MTPERSARRDIDLIEYRKGIDYLGRAYQHEMAAATSDAQRAELTHWYAQEVRALQARVNRVEQDAAHEAYVARRQSQNEQRRQRLEIWQELAERTRTRQQRPSRPRQPATPPREGEAVLVECAPRALALGGLDA